MMTRKTLLLLASLTCYTYFVRKSILLFLLLAFLIVLADRLKGKKIYKLIVSITFGLILAGFVYLKFFSGSASLVGYSVFAFCGISFLIDQYQQKEEYLTIDIGVYLFFFPKMWAGPILRARDFVPQLSSDKKFPPLYPAMKIILYACFLKFILADNLALYDKEYYGINLFLSTLVWGIRFYLDFYAYSLLAVGLALCAGLAIPYNFDKPYLATTFREFWGKWNITLSSWLKDYVYIPLGGSRKRAPMVCLNIIITFLVSGLWHGISMPFIVWGMCHGFLVCLEHFLKPQKHSTRRISKTAYRLFVVLTVVFLWQLFKFEHIHDIVQYLRDLLTYSRIDLSLVIGFCLTLVVLAMVDSGVLNKLVFKTDDSQKYIICEVTFYTLIIAALVLLPIQYSFNFFYLKF